MTTEQAALEVDEDFVLADADEAEPVAEVSKSNLSKRRTIDNLLEERRLKKQLDDYNFDF
ncbi:MULTISPECIES: PA3496 family putative envelope integrity protein [Pseudomonas]|uniref:Leucyl-tRNA synthetase n=1 Tax=Pseudomonas quercus TaxID=2722792 RepID=A0ABX0Y9X7_9PSED|nr:MULTISPECIES: hypothetical protein [Pseudomonas]MBF7141595.1 hypothetical protein [Pseudomonas sp. LY10J]NJP00134.1 hypothetical protein [Pseudomonas quercus]